MSAILFWSNIEQFWPLTLCQRQSYPLLGNSGYQLTNQQIHWQDSISWKYSFCEYFQHSVALINANVCIVFLPPNVHLFLVWCKDIYLNAVCRIISGKSDFGSIVILLNFVCCQTHPPLYRHWHNMLKQLLFSSARSSLKGLFRQIFFHRLNLIF